MPVAHQNGGAAAEIGTESLDEVYRAVPASRAAYGDRERAPVVLSIGGQPGFDEAPDVLEHRSDFRLLLEEGDHGSIKATQGAKPRIVMRVGEAAHVEDEVRIQGNALLVAEGLEQQHHRLGSNVEQVLDPVAQGIWQQVGRVEALSDLADRSEELPLARETFLQGSRARCERMAVVPSDSFLNFSSAVMPEPQSPQVISLVKANSLIA